MSIEKNGGFKSPEFSSTPSIEQKEQAKEKLLQEALQESYELNLNAGHIVHAEKISEDRGISLNSEIFQIAYDAQINKGDIYTATRVAKLAEGKGLKLTPKAESLQLGYEKAMEMGKKYDIEKIKQFAQEKGIKLTVNKDAIQKWCDYALENGDSGILKEIKKIAKKERIELEVKKEVLQKTYDKKLNELEDLISLTEIEQFAKQNDIDLEVNKKILQQGLENYIEYAAPREPYENLLADVKKIINFATKKGVKINIDDIDDKKVQELYEKGLINGDSRMIKGMKNLASEKGIDLDIQKLDLQELYDKFFTDGEIYIAQQIKEIGDENGLEVKVPSKEKIQKNYDILLASGNQYGALKIQQFSGDNGIAIEIKKDMLQKAYETICNGNMESVNLNYMSDLEEMAKDNGYEIENAKELIEKTYIEVIHNLNMGHAGAKREGLIKKLKELGSDLTYEDVIKMDYLDYLKVPEEQRLSIQKTMEIDGAPIRVSFYGQKQEAPVHGKFIIGTSTDNGLEFVFDSTLGEHGDIGNKYNLEVIGGGWLEIDEINKKIKIHRNSEDYGYEPRSISKRVIADTFSDYEIIV
ncbi:MAG: hypothetical protein ACKKL5_01695 [Candidatus Komeilibacteria bacterium]